jgi:nicotinate-nucleotide--dimethylbenzimidazole phosphoribosyltransferase
MAGKSPSQLLEEVLDRKLPEIEMLKGDTSLDQVLAYIEKNRPAENAVRRTDSAEIPQQPPAKAAEAAATPAASKPEPVEPRQKTMRLSVPKPVNKEPKVEEKAEVPATPEEESPAPAPEAEIPAAPETPAEIPATTTPEAEAPVEATPVPEAPAEESPEKEQDKVTC